MQTKALRARVVVWIGALLVLSSIGVATRVHAGESRLSPRRDLENAGAGVDWRASRRPVPRERQRACTAVLHLQVPR